MTWKVGELEQKLHLLELKKQIQEVKAIKIPTVIQAYYEPSRQDWEQIYFAAYPDLSAIVPGSKLCWLDLKRGRFKSYSTAWDRENGKASSGEIYEYSTPQNADLFRYVGAYNIGAFENSLSINFSNNTKKWLDQGINILEIFFRIDWQASTTPISLSYIFGQDGSGFYVPIDASGDYGHGVYGGPSVTPTNTVPDPLNLSLYTPMMDMGLRPVAVGLENEPGFGKIYIFNPFGAYQSDGKLSGFAQTSVLGWIVTPNAAYTRSTVSGAPVSTGALYRQFVGIRSYPENSKNVSRVEGVGNDFNNQTRVSKKGKSWVYAYFSRPQSGELTEYD